MYQPAAFRNDDPDVHRAVIDAYPFATLVTAAGGVPYASHLPFLFDGDAIVGHLARANPQGRLFEAGRGGGEAMVVFNGPHAYVSPRWYASEPQVPTWNFVAVHVYGVPELVDPLPIVRRLSARFDPDWRMDEAFVDSLLGAIVGVRIPLTRVEGKLKLSQNRSPADAEGARAGLSAGGEEERAVAAWMGRWMG
ncbi:MAG: FMN-binding negative transcriptional regulator [Pseudomonadota bacterium]|nr:FMN-binding negative transcriptional regulator [Pseudomonadota bacterium]